MNYIKRFESSGRLFEEQSIITKNDIIKIESVINGLKYILEDEGLTILTSFADIDFPILFIEKKFKDNGYFYPKYTEDSDEVTEFIDRISDELKGFEIKISNFQHHISLDIIKQ